MKNKLLLISIIISTALIINALIFAFHKKENNRPNPIIPLLEHLNKKEPTIPEWEAFVVEDTPNSKSIIRESDYLKYLEAVHEEEQLKKRRENAKELKEIKEQEFLNLKTEFITPIKENSAIFITNNDPLRNKNNNWASISYINSINNLNDTNKHARIISGQYSPSIQFYKNKVFYVNTNGEITNIDIITGEEQIIKTPEISFPTNHSNSISSIFISNDILFYNKGLCGELIDCDFGMYNLISGETVVLIKN